MGANSLTNTCKAEDPSEMLIMTTCNDYTIGNKRAAITRDGCLPHLRTCVRLFKSNVYLYQPTDGYTKDTFDGELAGGCADH